MKIFAASDLHGNLSKTKRLAEKADKYGADAVIICGDFADFGEVPKGMFGAFMKKGRKLMFVTGNHETPAIGEFIGEKYHITNLQGYSVKIGDVGFFGCGGADIPMNFISEKDMEKYLEKGWNVVKDCRKKVMVTHMHPKGSGPEKESKFEGSEAITKVIEKRQPDLHIHGHIHETEGFETVFRKTLSINLGPEGRLIEL